MNDAIVLLSISQVVCLGGMAYLYLQFQGLTRRGPRPRHANANIVMDRQAIRVHDQPEQHERPERAHVPAPMAARAYANNPATELAAAKAIPAAAAMALAAEGNVDVSTIARRMNRSEEEVRLLLRRQAVRR